MDKQKLEQFNIELKALLVKYDCQISLEDGPATKRLVVIPNKKLEEVVEKDGTELPEEPKA